mmetsp:Transcript_18128/g.27354  ORF Transcript_18128/g.27354 Transcript_18128/m.27354 type:complete len:640 (-) Transcript_18128:219-2138(-)|eukprot:CAMPEP_0197319200 /NCGR_PEP_ID=MMETSP0891-20130614/53809_1 /TAXON_ID=44058 ORGANISM="Aureoumbra lagunensis, Strain CCMP1510" /NCGR_SAMPLE_ID=MMETSP0891 /ASSEMBLY_ACC=CAM_ASM_000534 /LENGTH=639 /DNA_ID=CAMNT_0042810005 /DNA_START=45 /DNA_END=1964 /DNA_ORIENTATION=-
MARQNSRINILRNIWKRKSLASFAAEEEDEHEEAGLGLFDLICIGIGGTVGSGVFVLTGEVLSVAGASASLCWLIGGSVCLLSALSYMELSSRLPTRGSTYAYAYHGLGEFAAVAGATSLTLEYGLSGAGVARSWSAKFANLLDVSIVTKYFYTPYTALGSGRAHVGAENDTYIDAIAALLQIGCAIIIARGFSLSKPVVNSMTLAKVVLVLFLIIAGFAGTRRNVFASPDTFFAKGPSGVATGTSLLFFGFIGFDEVCCMAARCKNPRHIMPRAIAGTLFGAALLSTFAQLALAGLATHDDEDDKKNPTSFEKAFRQRNWIIPKYIAEIGEVLLLPLVVLLSFMPQPELLAALGKDGLISQRFATLRGDVYLYGCFVCGISLTIVSLMVPFEILWNTINLGVLLGFNLSNASLLSVRAGNGGTVTNKPAATLILIYGIFLAPFSAYLLWKGALGPAVNSSSIAPLKSILGLTLGGLGLLLLCTAIIVLRLLADLIKSSTAANKIILTTSQQASVLDQSHHQHNNTPSNQIDNQNIFQAPGVPYLPGLAIFLNFMLMAQYTWLDHVYLFILYAAAYLFYFYSKFGGENIRAKSSSLDFNHNNLDIDNLTLRDDHNSAGTRDETSRQSSLDLDRPLLHNN